MAVLIAKAKNSREGTSQYLCGSYDDGLIDSGQVWILTSKDITAANSLIKTSGSQLLN